MEDLNIRFRKMHSGRKQNKMTSKVTAEMPFILFLLQFLLKIIDAGSCDILFPKENDLTLVRSINQGSDLSSYLSGNQ